MCPCGSTPMLLGSFVLVSAVIWWMNSKFEQLINEIKKINK